MDLLEDDDLLEIRTELQSPGHKMKTLASSKRVPQLLSAIDLSDIAFQDGSHHRSLSI